jgi:hypothetical protein
VRQIFGAWSISRDNYYAALAALSVNSGPQSINSGVTQHQRSSLDPMLRYYPGLPPSDPNYIPRPDGSVVPPLILFTGIDPQPGDKDDKLLMQLIKADVQFFLRGAFITPPSRASKVSTTPQCQIPRVAGCVPERRMPIENTRLSFFSICGVVVLLKTSRLSLPLVFEEQVRLISDSRL